MSKVITFSRTFPGYHPRAGEPTYFVEKIWAGLAETQFPSFKIPKKFTDYDWHEYYMGITKYHTIRSGHRWKAGDKFSPRVWSGKPYNSKQVIIAPDIEILKTWDFEIDLLGGEYRLKGFTIHIDKLSVIAKNDGFEELDDFECWFKLKRDEGFLGQIICWNKDINY